MNLTIDIGNSSIKYAIFNGKKMLTHGRTIGHDILSIQKDVEKYATQQCIVCSTINLSEEIKKQIGEVAGQDCIVTYLDHTTPIPIKNLYKTPETLGTDRLAAAIGAYCKVKNDVLIVDSGTAITYDFVNKKGEYLGGNISPGMDIRFKALHDYTAKLPLVSPEGDKPMLGENTETAIRCGVKDGIKHEIEGYLSEFLLKYPNLSIFLTGADAIYFDDVIKNRTFADEYLVLEGLNDILRHIESQNKTNEDSQK